MNSTTQSKEATALIVIDVQASFTHRPYFSTEGLDEYLKAQNALIAAAQAKGWPIVRVLHITPDGPADDPFAIASGHVRPLEGLAAFDAALTVHKTRHSALVGTGLDVWLTEHGIRHLVISGIRTEQCCETTARHASDLGWKVTYVPEATMTWPMRTPSRTTLSTDALRERTATVLDGRFARVCSVAQAGDA
jgi:nicotinamidase-related amidase